MNKNQNIFTFTFKNLLDQFSLSSHRRCLHFHFCTHCPFWGRALPLTCYLYTFYLSVMQALQYLQEADPKLPMGSQIPLNISSTYFLIITCHFLFNDYCHCLFFMWILGFLTKFQTLMTSSCVLLGWTWFLGRALFISPLPQPLPEIWMTGESIASVNHREHCCIIHRKVVKRVDPNRFYHKKNFFFFPFDCIYIRWWMLTKPIVTIISQYI